MDTQGSVDMIGLVGSLINRSGANQGEAPSPAGAASGSGSMDEAMTQ
jgi:hypothetical protein